MGWCGSCETAARELGQELEGRVQAVTEQGGLVAHLLLTGNSSSEAPSDEEVHNWARAAELEISVLGPADERTREVFPDREWVFVVNLETMEVVFRQEVALYVEPRVSEVGLTELERQLAQ